MGNIWLIKQVSGVLRFLMRLRRKGWKWRHVERTYIPFIAIALFASELLPAAYNL
jgi:hypothetical protein